MAMKTAAYDMYSQSTHESANNWDTIKNDYPNVKVRTFPREVIDALRKANDELVAEKSAEDPLAREIIESQLAYLKKARKWIEISDEAYLNSISAVE